MKKLRPTLIAFLFILFSNCLFSQDLAAYKKYTSYAEELYEMENYTNAAKAYSLAFKAVNNTGTVEDRYKAAQACAQADQLEEAFEHMFRIARSGRYTNIDELKTDPALYNLHYEKGWDELCQMVLANKEKMESTLIQPLATELEQIYDDNRKYREEIKFIGDEYGWDSEEVYEIYDLILEQDSINAVKVAKILDTHGWLGSDKVGKKGNAALYLALLQADMDTQEKYLPLLREAVKKGIAPGSKLASIEDKIAVAKGKRQIYGSQILLDEESGRHFVSPLSDPDNVDARRAEVGLLPMSEYLKRWDIHWDVETYKKELALYEEKAAAIMARRQRIRLKWIWQEDY